MEVLFADKDICNGFSVNESILKVCALKNPSLPVLFMTSVKLLGTVFGKFRVFRDQLSSRNTTLDKQVDYGILIATFEAQL